MNSRSLISLIIVALMVLPTFASTNSSTCPSCGAIGQSEGLFCGRCGAKLQRDIAPPQSAPQPVTNKETPPLGTLDPSVHQLISQLSDQDLRRIIEIMLQRLETRQEQLALDPTSVAMMSRRELEELLQKHSYTQPPPPKTSSFTGFLQFIGGAVLFILAISIIASI